MVARHTAVLLAGIVASTTLGAGFADASPTTNGAGVLIGLVGTSGIQGSVPALRGHLVAGWSRDGGDGLTDFTGHDTGVASVLAGVAPGAKIIPGTRDWCAGLDYVVAKGATVVVIPQISYQDIPCLRTAVASAVAEDVVVVSGVGNSGVEHTGPTYPADYPSVIGAGSVDAADWRPSWSDVGPSVDLVALGDNVTVATRDGGTTPASGNSYSSAHIAGYAADIRSAQPAWTAAEVVAALRESAVDLGARGRDWWFGDGLTSTRAAVDEVGVRDPGAATCDDCRVAVDAAASVV